MKNKIRLPLQVFARASLVMFFGVARADAKAHHPNHHHQHHQLIQTGSGRPVTDDNPHGLT